MFAISYLLFFFCVLFSAVIFIVIRLNKNATPLGKAWNSYIAMIVLHLTFFVGLMFALPPILPSQSMLQYDIDKIQSIDDVKSTFNKQHRDLEQVREQADELREILNVIILFGLMFAPMCYYVLFKSNLRIEEISGKRMGSLD